MMGRDTLRQRPLVRALCLLAALGLAPAQTWAETAAQPPAATSFFDDFDDLDRKRWEVSNGWVNGRHQNCTWSPDQVGISGGLLTLSLAKQPNELRDYECAEIFTKRRYGHGVYETRMKTDTGSGMNAAFFTYIGKVHGAPHDEIDFEVLTRDPYRVSTNTYVAGEQKNGTTAPVPNGAHLAFTHYAFVWAPDRIAWYVDGKLIHEATETLPSHDQKIYFSMWGTDTLKAWMGRFDYPDRPVVMQVDWVGYSAPGDLCAFAQSFTCQPEFK